MRMPVFIWTLLLVILAGPVVSNAAYPTFPGNDYDEDFLQIRVLDDQLIAVRSHLPAAVVDLDVGEHVLDVRFEGRVGGVLTNNRFLAISTDAQAWSQEELDIDETYSGSMILSEDMVLLTTQQRAIVYDGQNDETAEYDLPLGENIITKDVGYRAAAFVTGQHAVAYGLGRQHFSVVEFDPSENFRRLSISYGEVSVVTSDRLLTYSAASGDWSARPVSEMDERLQQ